MRKKSTPDQSLIDAIAAVLRANDNEAMTIAEISPAVQWPVDTVRLAVVYMRAAGMIERVGKQHCVGGQMLYVINHSALPENPATPRQHIGRGTYAGPDWSASTMRPGCMDHLAVPSLRPGGVRIPHRAPMGM